MRVRKPAPAAPAEPVPEHLACFRESDWFDPDEPVPVDHRRCGADEWTWRAMRAHRRWSDARQQWATGHGFDMTARYGEAPGRDRWAFDRLAAGMPDWWRAPRSLAELNEPYAY